MWILMRTMLQANAFVIRSAQGLTFRKNRAIHEAFLESRAEAKG
jgi:hypothetical protein